jgi:hypothetical protein
MQSSHFFTKLRGNELVAIDISEVLVRAAQSAIQLRSISQLCHLQLMRRLVSHLVMRM